MPSVLFYLFSAIMLGFGILVVVLRNPVSSALSLAMSFLGLAALDRFRLFRLLGRLGARVLVVPERREHQHRRPHRIVERSVVDRIPIDRLANADVIVMCGQDHHFVA